VDAVLEPGAISDTVTVTATEGQLLKTDRADVATTFETKQITDLPSFLALAQATRFHETFASRLHQVRISMQLLGPLRGTPDRASRINGFHLDVVDMSRRTAAGGAVAADVEGAG
jgi:hypothetical protein